MGERRCPACSGALGLERGEKNGLRVSECRTCGTLYAHPSAERAGYDYDTYYHEANLSVPAFIDQRLDEILASFASYRQTNRLLDIGCGAGSLLQAARRAGWEAEGTEVSPPSVEHVRAQGFKVFCGELAEAGYPEGHFDVVTASEILEHLPNPQAMLDEIARILRPGGLFWGTTPHGRSLSAHMLGLRWSAVYPPEHLQLFSTGGLRRMLKAAGFRQARISTQGLNPYEIWHGLRRERRRGSTGATTGAAEGNGAGAAESENGGESSNRVCTGYQLNEAMMRNSAARAVKAVANTLLSAMRLGDSVKIRAEK